MKLRRLIDPNLPAGQAMLVLSPEDRMFNPFDHFHTGDNGSPFDINCGSIADQHIESMRAEAIEEVSREFADTIRALGERHRAKVRGIKRQCIAAAAVLVLLALTGCA